MEVNIKVSDRFGLGRKGYVIEQGIPVHPLEREDISKLALVDEKGKVIPAAIEHDGRDENDKTVWVRVSAAVDIPKGKTRNLKLVRLDSVPQADDALEIRGSASGAHIQTPFYELHTGINGQIRICCNGDSILEGPLSFQLWPDARSIVGGGGGTCRIASFIPLEWSIEERSATRCLLVLKGRVPKFEAYTGNPHLYDKHSQFDCELELIVNALSPVIRYRWRIENQCNWQCYLERYAVRFPLADGARITGGEKSSDGKYLRWLQAATPGGTIAITANFVEVLGEGAGLNAERRENLGALKADRVKAFAGKNVFEPHRYLAAKEDNGYGLDLVTGGINPPQDATMWADNPEVHRLFYRGMGRTFDGAFLINASKNQIECELNPIWFTLEADYYSKVGALPENGDPVHFGRFREIIFNSAEWMLNEQWKGSLWWGEWWREYDNFRAQGIEATANGNNPLGPLYHYWRTGDERFVDCGKRSMEFVYDIQLCKRRDALAPFFHSRRFLIDMMEWVHMRYQRIEGPIKMAHFLGDRRLREKIIDAMRKHAEELVMPDGAPGFGEGGAKGKAVPAGSDCTNFGEVLGICYRETGERMFLDKAKKMARWTMRFMSGWDWNEYVGNSYGWHFLMRGMLSTIKLTGEKDFIDWYLDMAAKNMGYAIEEIEFVQWMNWIITEAAKMLPEGKSVPGPNGTEWDERAIMDKLLENTLDRLKDRMASGVIENVCKYPWSKWPSTWQYIYDPKCIVAYIPVMTAHRKALGMGD